MYLNYGYNFCKHCLQEPKTVESGESVKTSLWFLLITFDNWERVNGSLISPPPPLLLPFSRSNCVLVVKIKDCFLIAILVIRYDQCQEKQKCHKNYLWTIALFKIVCPAAFIICVANTQLNITWNQFQITSDNHWYIQLLEYSKTSPSSSPSSSPPSRSGDPPSISGTVVS